MVRAFAIHRRVEDMVTAASRVRFRWPSQFQRFKTQKVLETTRRRLLALFQACVMYSTVFPRRSNY